jgi:chemotaxis regulatin CheY-phosphate phosphatase CheZ
MADEIIADLPVTEQAAEPQGIDAHISKAMENFDAPDTAAPPAEGGKSEADIKADATGRVHGKDGKFVAKESKTDAKPSDGASKAAETVAPVQPAVDPAQEQQIAPHPRWPEARKAAFNALTPEARKFALDVQAEHEAAFTRKSQEDADYRRSADPIVQAVQPFQEYLQKVAPVAGMTPGQLINGLLSAEYQLRTGDPRTKYQAIAQIAQTYGVDLAALTRGEIAQPDPLINQLRQQVSELTQQFGAVREQQTAQEQQRSLSLHIDTFASAKDEAGQPKYPHFERVRGYMGQLMANGQGLDTGGSLCGSDQANPRGYRRRTGKPVRTVGGKQQGRT